MSAFLNTVFAKMLSGREIDRQRKIDEQHYQDEQRRVGMRQALEEQRLVDNAKQAEFDRHRRVAEMEARAAALKGDKTAPSGYFNPAVQEMADVAFGGGEVDRGVRDWDRGMKVSQERGKNYRDTNARMASTINDWDVAKEPSAYRAYEEQIGLPENSLSDRPYGERFSPRSGGGKDMRLAKFEDAYRALKAKDPGRSGPVTNVAMQAQVGLHSQMMDTWLRQYEKARNDPDNADWYFNEMNADQSWVQGNRAMGATSGRMFFDPGVGTTTPLPTAPARRTNLSPDDEKLLE